MTESGPAFPGVFNIDSRKVMNSKPPFRFDSERRRICKTFFQAGMRL